MTNYALSLLPYFWEWKLSTTTKWLLKISIQSSSRWKQWMLTISRCELNVRTYFRCRYQSLKIQNGANICDTDQSNCQNVWSSLTKSMNWKIIKIKLIKFVSQMKNYKINFSILEEGQEISAKSKIKFKK